MGNTVSWGEFAIEHGLIEVVPDLLGDGQDKIRLTLSGAMMLKSFLTLLPEDMPRSQRNLVQVVTTNLVNSIIKKCEDAGQPLEPKPPKCRRTESDIVIASN